MSPLLLAFRPPALALAAALLLASCTETPQAPSSNAPATEATNSGRPTASTSNDALEPCAVHLFDDEDFDLDDDHVVITGPGRFASLKDLPNAQGKDWTREADSFRLGGEATMTTWPQPDFQGPSQRFEPGTEVADLDGEIGSLELTC